MLFLEPIADHSQIPREIVEIVEALEERGFPVSYKADLELINRVRSTPLIELDGKFLYDGVVVGYLRGLR